MNVAHPAHCSDCQLLRPSADDPTAGILHILSHQFGQFAKGHAHGLQCLRLRLNHILLFITSALVDLRNTRHHSQQRLDRVFLDLA